MPGFFAALGAGGRSLRCVMVSGPCKGPQYMPRGVPRMPGFHVLQGKGGAVGPDTWVPCVRALTLHHGAGGAAGPARVGLQHSAQDTRACVCVC